MSRGLREAHGLEGGLHRGTAGDSPPEEGRGPGRRRPARVRVAQASDTGCFQFRQGPPFPEKKVFQNLYPKHQLYPLSLPSGTAWKRPD